MLTSQSVKAYSASIVLSDEVPGARCTSISTLAAVLSSTLRILIFPLSTAFRMESMTVEVVLPYGISVMASVFVVQLVDLGAYFYRSAAFSVIVFGYVDGTACLEVGI